MFIVPQARCSTFSYMVIGHLSKYYVLQFLVYNGTCALCTVNNRNDSVYSGIYQLLF